MTPWPRIASFVASVSVENRTRNGELVRAGRTVRDHDLADVVERDLPTRTAVLGRHHERRRQPGRKFAGRLPEVGNVDLRVAGCAGVRVRDDDVRDGVTLHTQRELGAKARGSTGCGIVRGRE
jgi:hypothetical protein